MSKETQQYLYTAVAIITFAALALTIPPLSWFAWNAAFLTSLTLLTITVIKNLNQLKKPNQQ